MLIYFVYNAYKFKNKDVFKMDSKISERLKDRSFVEKLMGFGTPDEVKSFFKTEGLEITDNDVKEMATSFGDILSKFKDVPDEELNQASGGLGNPVKYVHGKLTDAFNTLGANIGAVTDEEFKKDPSTLYKDNFLGRAGESLQANANKYATGVMSAGGAAAAIAIAYAGYKKGWPALKTLGQKKGWWN